MSRQQEQQHPPVTWGTIVLPAHSEDVDEELRRVRLALHAVYSSAPTVAIGGLGAASSTDWWQHRQLADRYLTSFQNATSIAWIVCDRILHEPDVISSIESGGHSQFRLPDHHQQQERFFAAQTLHKKCRSDVFELPETALPSLRDSLLQHLQRYEAAGQHSGGSALTTRLALCLSALAVQMGWYSIVQDLLRMTASSSSTDPPAVAVVMSILEVLPEECASDRLLLANEQYRYAIRDQLVASAPLVFGYLQAVSTTSTAEQGATIHGGSSNDHPNFKLAVRVLQALHTWIRYVPINPGSLVDSPLLAGAMQALRHPELVDYAADVVVEVLRMYPSDHYANEGLVQMMLPLLSQLPLEEALQSADEDILRAYCRVVTEMGESYMSLVLSPSHHKDSGAALVQWVLRCSAAIADTEIASITLHFWYRMAMDLESIDPLEWRQELVDSYAPLLLGLVDVCVTHLMRYPPDLDLSQGPKNPLSEDTLDDLHRHRFYVAETVEDCCRLLGGHVVLERIGVTFQEEVQRLQQLSMNNSTTSEWWPRLESCFACIEAIHRFIPNDESRFLPLCFNLIPQLPIDIYPLRFTACKLIGKYAAWLAIHGDLLQPLLPYLAQALPDRECASAAAVSIKELCECANPALSIAEPVLQLYNSITNATNGSISVHGQTLAPQLDIANELQILEGLSRALSRHIEVTRSDGMAFLSQLVHPLGARLSSRVADENASAKQVIVEIERLTVVVQHFRLPRTAAGRQHPLVELMLSLWNQLDAATSRFSADFAVAEKICRLHKYSLRSCGARAYAPLVDALLQQLVRSFEMTRQSPFIYAASICVLEYGPDPAYTQRLLEACGAIAGTAFLFLRTADDLKNFPDVVEELFYLMGRTMKCIPAAVVMQNPPMLLASLVECAVSAMQLDHSGASKAAMTFVEDTVTYGLVLQSGSGNQRSIKPEDCWTMLEAALSPHAPAIVANLVRTLMGELLATSDRVPDLLWKMNQLVRSMGQHLVQWVADLLASTPSLPDRVKQDLTGAFDAGLAQDEFRLAVRAFQVACEHHRRFQRK